MLRLATQLVQELQAIMVRIPCHQHQVNPLALDEGQGLGFIAAGVDPLTARRFQGLAHKRQLPQDTVGNQIGRVRMGLESKVSALLPLSSRFLTSAPHTGQVALTTSGAPTPAGIFFHFRTLPRFGYGSILLPRFYNGVPGISRPLPPIHWFPSSPGRA